MNKYRNNKVEVDGIKFDSKKEANRYLELKLLERAGEISDLELQPEFVLLPSYVDNQGRRERVIKYISDFKYTDNRNGKVYVEDVKSNITKKDKTYVIKKKFFKNMYPEYIFIENC